MIVTHAHQDHYAGFTRTEGSLFDLFEVGTIIDFALTNQEDKDNSNMYGRYLNEREAEIQAGAKHYTAAECVEKQKTDGAFDLVILHNNEVVICGVILLFIKLGKDSEKITLGFGFILEEENIIESFYKMICVFFFASALVKFHVCSPLSFVNEIVIAEHLVIPAENSVRFALLSAHQEQNDNCSYNKNRNNNEYGVCYERFCF